MLKFFLKIPKSKTLTFFLIGFVVLGVLLPAKIFAQPGAGETIATQVILGPIVGTAVNIYELLTGTSAVGSAIAGMWKEIFKGVVYAFGSVLLYTTGTLYGLAALLFSWVTSPNFMTLSYTGMDNPVIKIGWAQMRDLANMFVALGFILVGIATTLRIQTYQAQKTLLPLIIVAILINFSPLICGIIIDASNIITNHFLFAANPDTLSKVFQNAASQQVGILEAQYTSDSSPLTLLGLAVSGAVFNTMIFIILFMFSFLFAARYVVLWILVALAPIAFFCYVFDFTKKFFSMWWTQFLQWSFVAAPAAFFIYLANSLAVAFKNNPNLLAGPPESGIQTFNLLVVAFIPCLLLLAGFMISLQVGAIGAGAIMGGAKNILTKGGKAVAGAAGRKIQKTDTYQKISGGVGRSMEKLGLREVGTTATNQQALLKSSADTMKNARNDNPETFKRTALSGSGMGSAAALRVAAEEGDLAKWNQTPADHAKIRGAMARAKGHGVSMDTFHKSDPVLAMQNPSNPNAQDLQAISGVVSNMDKKESRGLIKKGVPVKPQLLGALSGGQMGDILKNAKPAQLTTLQQSVQGAEGKNAVAYMNTLIKSGNRAEARNMMTNIQMIKSSGIKAPPRPPASTAAKPATPPSPKPAPTGPNVAPRGTSIPPPGAGVKAPTGPSAPPRGTPVAPSAKPKPAKRP